MQTPIIPSYEAERLRALHDLEILDTASEQRFDRLTRMAQSFCQVPIALICLIDSERQWFKSKQGLALCETAREFSFCGHAILQTDIFIIPDARLDPRFANNPLVTGFPHFIAYVGVPLILANGQCIGTLCVIDHQPRQFSDEQYQVLRDLAIMLIHELELKQIYIAHRQNQSILDNANYSIITCDTKGILQSFNKASQSMLGYRAEDVIGIHTPAIYLDPDEMRSCIELLTTELGGPKGSGLDDFLAHSRLGHADEFECTYIRNDGGRIPVLLTVNSLRDDTGAISGFLWTANDISHEKAAKIAAQESEARFQDLFDSANDLIQSVANDGRILYVNRAWLHTLKYEADDVAKLSLFDVIAPECREYCFEQFQKVLSGASVERVETTFIAKDNSRVIVEGSSNCHLVNGKPIATRSIFRDITQRKQHEQHILEQQKLLELALIQNQSILDNANYSIISTDVNGIIATFNKGAEAMLGYRAEEVVHQTTPLIFHEPTEIVARAKLLSLELKRPIEANMDVFLAKAKLGLVGEMEWTYRHKEGHVIPVLLTVTAQKNQQGEFVGFLGIASDITERKRIERMKNEFVSTVSHELRTPLTSIRGALGMVLGKASAGMSDKAKMLIETASRNSERLTLLINDILDLEKIESGNLDFNMSPADLTTIARQAIASNEGYALQHHVDLKLRDSPFQAGIMGDEHRLLQVFSNLLSNAIKYSHANGVVDVSIVKMDRCFRVSIIDRGAGIPEAFHSQIFQRFAQADSSDTRAKGGTGLGLSITKAIVERHGGSIGYKSEVGVGTEFYFDLPEWLEIRTSKNDSRPKILICEDNTDAANILSHLLAQEDIGSDIVATGGAAQQMLAQNTYRALLLDLTLPDMDGRVLIRELLNDTTLRHLPIIVVSAWAEEGRHTFTDNPTNVVDWLQKPIDHERLLRALHHAIVKRKRPRILHVDDDLEAIQTTQHLIEAMTDYSYVPTLQSARELLMTESFDLVIMDVVLPDGSGLDLLTEIDQNTQVLIFSSHEPHRSVAEQVATVLMKSFTNSHSLLATIKEIIGLE